MRFTPHILALSGAFCSAAATILLRQGLRHSNFYAGFWMNVLVGAIILWGAVFLLAPPASFEVGAIPFFILSGLLGTATGRLLRVVSIEKVGAPVAASVNNLSPFIAVALAILFLGERITLPILLGTLVIVAGTILLSLSRKHVGFRVTDLAYPFLSASCFGMVAIIRKLGLSRTGPLFGSAVNNITALVAYAIFLLLSGKRQAVVCRGSSLWYFIGAGIAENASVFLVLVSLSLGEVSVVTPLAGTAPLFVLPMTSIFLRGVEKLSWRIVVGATLIVLGVFLLTA